MRREKDFIGEKLEISQEELYVTKALLPLKFEYDQITLENKIMIFQEKIKDLQKRLQEEKK